MRQNLFKCCITLIFLICSCASVNAQEQITKVSQPKEVVVEVNNRRGIPQGLEGLIWNRWTSKNFVVCSLNNAQAQYLYEHLEFVKGWVFVRWGLYDVDFSVPCKFICMDDPVLFKKWFNINKTQVEVRLNEAGNIKETIVFLLINGPPSQNIPIPLTEICLAEFAQKYHTRFGVWAYKGMSQLNGSLEQIRSNIADIKHFYEKNEPIFFSKSLLEMNVEDYDALSSEKQKIYDTCALVFCLMIRKEFGQESYLNFLKNGSEGDPQKALQDVLKFENYDQFDRSFKRYIKDITKDIINHKTPDTYLQIRES